MTDTATTQISDALADAIARAERWVDENELSHSTREARIALHAVLNYISALGANGEDHVRVLYLLSDATATSYSRGYADRVKVESQGPAKYEPPF